jgi:hypothetical protein
MRTLLQVTVLVALGIVASRAEALELYYYNNTGALVTLPDPPPAVAAGRRPVLFVHGHRFDFFTGDDNDSDTDPKYQVNFIRRLNIGAGMTLPSFDLTIVRNSNLNIEPYYIRFVDQARSISHDANDVSAAVDLIVRRHNPGFDVINPPGPPEVQVAIIGYSKGTISARQYLQRLHAPVSYPDGVMPLATRTGYRPVSEFIAISPPNHGISSGLFRLSAPLSLQQLHNGRKGRGTLTGACGESYGTAAADHFIQILNGDNSSGFTVSNTPFIAAEAPDSRCEAKLPMAGPLYVTLYAENNADAVGGNDPSMTDCHGRKMARNLAEDAINIQIRNISGGSDEIAVHQRTVHTPEVICKALYTVVHRRPPAEREPDQPPTCTLDGDLPVIPPPEERAAAMLALDLSGSMTANACPGCGSRLAMLRDAVTLFLDTWWSMRPNDRVGVTYFRTSINEPRFNGERLPTLDSGRGLIVADLASTNPVPGNNFTAMGAGVQASIAELKKLPPHVAARPHVILFSDGMQNVNPMVQELSATSGFVIDNETGRTGSGTPPTDPLTRLNECTIAPVDTVAVGTGQPFLDQMQEIAAVTGGLSSAIDDAQGLREAFITQLINTLRGSSPQLVAYRRGAVQGGNATETFAANATARKVLLSVSWARGQTLNVRAFKNGVDITSSARVASGAFYRILTFDAPGPIGQGGLAGSWEVRVSGPSGAAYEASAIIDEVALSYRTQFGALRNLVGTPLELSVRVLGEKRPIDGRLTVTATVERPRIALGNLLQSIKAPEKPPAGGESKATPVEQRLAALIGDPEVLKQLRAPAETVRLESDGKDGYRAVLKDATVPGLYRATVRIVGEGGKYGGFERRETVSAIIRFAEADLAASQLTVSAMKANAVDITLRPRDKHGNLLGPGLASQVQLAVSNGRTNPGPEDLGDGRYRYRLTVPKGHDPTVLLVVAERLLFKGTLKALRLAQRK